jgi:O-antigen/teichoic acid export membrane protein
LLFNQLSSGQLVVLQGMRKLNYLAKANLSGSFIGLFITVPFYYLFGLDGIVPGIIGTSFVSMIMSWYYSGKIDIESIALSRSQTIEEGKNMLRLGFIISLNGIFVLSVAYIVRIFISRTGSLEQVGLYNAGFAIINTYVSLIFTAMATDYYPRLSAVANDQHQCNQTINQQAEIAILILSPILVIFLIFINWIIIILYSNKFTGVNDMVQWAALGMFFKAASWSVAFIFLAKGTTKLFFWNELVTNTYILGLNLLGFHFWGITGLGFSFALAYLIYMIQVSVISKIKFGFEFNYSFITIFIVQFILACAGFLTMKYLGRPFNYLIGIFLIGISGYYSIRELNHRLELKKLIKSYLYKQ